MKHTTLNFVKNITTKILVDEFAEHYDIDTVEHFEEMYQGQYDSGAEFAEQIATDCGYVTRELATLD